MIWYDLWLTSSGCVSKLHNSMTDRDDKGKMEDPANVIHNHLPLDPMTSWSRNAEETCSFGEYEVWPTEESLIIQGVPKLLMSLWRHGPGMRRRCVHLVSMKCDPQKSNTTTSQKTGLRMLTLTLTMLWLILLQPCHKHKPSYLFQIWI